MNEKVNILDIPWVLWISLGTPIVGFFVGLDYKFLPDYVNWIPLVSWFIGLFLSALIWSKMKPGPLFRLLRPLTVFLGTIVTLVLIVDRFGDMAAPEVIPARVVNFSAAVRFSPSLILVEATYPDGSTVRFPIRASRFPFIPEPGTAGKAVISRGLLGIRYWKDFSIDS